MKKTTSKRYVGPRLTLTQACARIGIVADPIVETPKGIRTLRGGEAIQGGKQGLMKGLKKKKAASG